MTDSSLVVQLVEKKGLVSEEQLRAVGQTASGKGDSALVDELVRKGFIERLMIVELLAEAFSMPHVDLSLTDLPEDPSELMSEELANRYRVVPIGMERGALQLAISDPLEIQVVDTISHILGMPIDPVLADERQIDQALGFAYREDRESVGGAAELSPLKAQVGVRGEEVELDAERSGKDEAPIIRLVQVIIADAIKARASDIHLEPLEKRFRLRFRVDGLLQEAPSPPPKRLQLPVISRIKVMARMSIAEKRLPQDGRIQIRVEGYDYDLRVSSLPTAYGESIVMRILDKKGLMMGLPELGFLSDDEEEFQRVITMPDGILLVTGPTGSGKTTTLYSCLNFINKPDRKIITVEDPIEYQMSGINQVPVRKQVGMTFAAALKAILRQAPNIIMVGEIRDFETAEIAINASLTGHMVFSTLHTNDAPSAVTRLVDIGIKPYLVATSLRAALAQRLVRRICRNCRQPYEPSAHELQAIGLPQSAANTASFMKGKGCAECSDSGTKGRFGIFENFLIDEQVERLIYGGATASKLRVAAREGGMRSMREDGIRKIMEGMTTIDEVVSVTVAEPRAY